MKAPSPFHRRSPRPDRVWNRIPDDVRSRVVTLALDQPELSPRELAVRFTDAERYFVSEASVYRLLKAHDLITSPAFITMKAADEFKNKTTAPNQLWQTDFTYLKVTPTSTSGAVKPSCWKEKGSNARPSKTVGCFTTNKPRNINHDAPDSLLVQPASVSKSLTTDNSASARYAGAFALWA
jgi:Homeodomain-like domain